MAKPLKYHQTLNQAPRSAKHGQHRRAGSSSHRHSVVRADQRAGGADPSGAVTISWSRAWDLAIAEPTPPAIPYAGIRTGEIIGHRLWWLIDGRLCSLAHRRLWLPGETIYGDTNKPVDAASVFKTIWGGTYAFSNPDSLRPEIEHYQGNIAALKLHTAHGFIWLPMDWHALQETETLVAGTIKMWGDVVEHETGYRAEFAKLNSIDALHGPGDIAALRSRYGVTAVSPDHSNGCKT